MPKFQKTVLITVLAVMFENTTEKEEEIQDFLKEAEVNVEKIDVNKNGKLTIVYVKEAEEGEKPTSAKFELIPGDWLVRDQYDNLSVIDSEEFAANFEVAT